jgi:hypothetical protein
MPEDIEGVLNGRRYRKLRNSPFASYPLTEEDFIDRPNIEPNLEKTVVPLSKLE